MGKPRQWAAAGARGAIACALALGIWWMLEASASYPELGDSHPFFLEKLPLARPDWWWAALYVHVPSALFSLPACLVLMVRALRVRFPRSHRWLGRITGALVLAAVVPSGMYLACFAQGGLVSTLGFWLTGVIAFVAMIQSIASARRRDFKGHRRFSTHVCAQLAVAVSSRFLLVGAEELGLYGTWVYPAALWIPVLSSLLFAELASGRRLWSRSKGSRHEELVSISRLDPVR